MSITSSSMLAGEAARLLNVSVRRVHDFDKVLQPARVGGLRVYERARVEQFATERAAKKAG